MSKPLTFLVGTYTEPILFGTGQVLESRGKGIYTCSFNPEHGEMSLLNGAQETPNPSYLALDASHRFLYAVNETKTYQGASSGAVSAFALDARGGLTLLNQQPSFGADPCHLTVHPTDKFLCVANFSGGSVSVFPIRKDGSLGEVSSVVHHRGSSLHPVRQTEPHPHAVTPVDKFLYVPDLGLDKIMIYELEGETLKPAQQPFVKVEPGAGPRQIVMRGRYAYLVNELNSTITIYERAKDTGSLEALQTLSTLPEGFTGDNICAELQFSNQFLYVSNRGHDSVAIFSISETDGRLTHLGHQSCGGKTPRHFTISPRGDTMLVANQDSDSVVVFKLDKVTGQLEATGQVLEIPTPVCVMFI